MLPVSGKPLVQIEVGRMTPPKLLTVGHLEGGELRACNQLNLEFSWTAA